MTNFLGSSPLITLLTILFISAPVSADFKSGGEAYKRGDYETAAKEFLPLAEKGDHRAMYALGSMYAAGNGVKQDLKEAYKWFSKAAQYGRPDAQYKLGIMYAQGLGVDQDYRRALSWFDKAAKLGVPQAQTSIGTMYLNGWGVTQNYVQAYAWSALGLKSGDKNAEGVVAEARKNLSDEQFKEAQEQADKYIRIYSSGH